MSTPSVFCVSSLPATHTSTRQPTMRPFVYYHRPLIGASASIGRSVIVMRCDTNKKLQKKKPSRDFTITTRHSTENRKSFESRKEWKTRRAMLDTVHVCVHGVSSHFANTIFLFDFAPPTARSRSMAKEQALQLQYSYKLEIQIQYTHSRSHVFAVLVVVANLRCHADG